MGKTKSNSTAKINNIESGAGSKQQKPVVVLAAGGKGTRIQPLNRAVPKPMIPIAGKPILQWEIESLVSQGFTDIIITVSHLANKIIDFFGDGSGYGAKIIYYNEEQPFGNAGALFKLWSGGQLTDTFLFLISDAIFDFNIERMLAYHEAHNALATLFTHPNSHPYDSSLLIIANDGSGRVERWLNKEDERPEFYKNIVNAGLQILTTELLEKSNIEPHSIGVGENNKKLRKVDLDRDVLKPLIPTGRIVSYTSSEYCKDAGNPERFYAVEEDIKSRIVTCRNLKRPQRAIFIERDGTINRYVGFWRTIDDFELLPSVAEAIRLINASPCLAIVAAKQPVVAKGEVASDELNRIHCKMETLLGESGAYIDGTFVCNHHSDLLLHAASEFNISLEESWYIGASWGNIEAVNIVGTKTVLLTGTGMEYACSSFCSPREQTAAILADYTADNLLDAVKIVLSQLTQPSGV